MNENEVLTGVQEGIQEGATNAVVEEVAKSTNNVLIKVAAGILLTAGVIGGAIFIKRRKAKKQAAIEAPVESDEQEVETIITDEVKVSE